jgi:hypothetical protein
MSIYILLSMQLALAGLVHGVYNALDRSKEQPSIQRKLITEWGSIALPVILVTISYGVETADVTVDNGVLNIARHAFSCSMRFADMTTEWLLLWVHFVWTGSLIVLFSVLSFFKIRALQLKTAGSSGASGGGANTNINASKNRLLRIAMMCAVCLLINLVCTLLTSVTLDDWATDSDLYLQCSLFETSLSRKMESYEFVDLQDICAPKDVTFSLSALGCKSDCTFHACVEGSGDVSCFGKVPDAFLCATTLDPLDTNDYTYCDCPCEKLITVQRPSMTVITLQYVAQSIVTCVVGINLGFRFVHVFTRLQIVSVVGGGGWRVARVFPHSWYFLCPGIIGNKAFWCGKIGLALRLRKVMECPPITNSESEIYLLHQTWWCRWCRWCDSALLI